MIRTRRPARRRRRCRRGSRRSGEIGAVHGPNGERGSARLALTDADRDGRDLVVALDARPRARRSAIDAIGNVVATRPGPTPTWRTGDDGLAHRHGRAPAAGSTATSGCSAAWRWSRRSTSTGRHDTAVAQVAFFTDEEGARFQPDMLGSLVYVGGLALEEALDVAAADDGARLGDELRPHRLRRRACRARRRRRRTRTSSCTSSRARCWRTRASPSASSPGCRASRGPRSPSPGSRRTPAPRRCGCATTRVRARRPSPPACVHRPASWAATRSATVGRIELHPNLVNVVPSRVGHDRRPAQHRRVASAAGRGRVRRTSASSWRHRRASTITTRTLARFEPVEFDAAHGRPRGADRERLGLLDPTDAERGRPRRPDAGAGVSDVDDLRPERERAVPQHRRVHRTRPTSRPAPTCCCRSCSIVSLVTSP